MPRVLITGAAGFLGSHLCDRFMAEGFEVLGILVVGTVFVEHVEGRDHFGMAAAIVLPHALVKAVVEVEEFEILELRRRGAEQLLAELDPGIHRSADVEEQQQFDRIVPFRAHMDVEPALAGGAVDRRVDIELVGRAFACETAQAAHRDLDVAGAEFAGGIEVLERALVPDLERALVDALTTDADAFGVVAGIAIGRGAAGADPLAAALVALLLFFKTLLESLHELVPAHGLDLLLLFLAEIFLGQLLQPLLGNLGLLHGVEQAFKPLEHRAEDAVELVEVALILHQRGPRQVVEILHRIVSEVGVERLHQREVFAQRHGDLRIAQRGEELQEHG